MTVVQITWLDSCVEAHWEPDARPGLAEIHSIGWLIQRTDTLITIAQSLDTDGNSAERLTVPSCNITELRFLQ